MDDNIESPMLKNDNQNKFIVDIDSSENSTDLDDGNKSCRICYETNHSETMLVPCLCSGDLKYVHRKCLDDYRAISVSNPAFTTCNTCSFDYIMEIEREHGCCRSPKAIFRLRVAFDILKIAFCWFGVVSLIAFIIYMTKMFEKHDLVHSYLWASGIVFGMMGIAGLLHGCYNLCSGDNHSSSSSGYHGGSGTCCDGCIWMGPIHCGGGSCDCGNCDGEAGAIISAILLILAIVLIIIGVVYAIIVSSVLITQMAATHYSRLNAKLMSREYVVKNLEKYSKKKILKMQQKQKLKQEGQFPQPSAPELDGGSDQNSFDIKQKKQKTITIM